MESMILKLFDQRAKRNGRRFLLPLLGPGAVGVVVDVVNRIPLGLMYSLASVVLVVVVVVCEDELVVCSDCCCCSVPSTTVVFVEGSFV